MINEDDVEEHDDEFEDGVHNMTTTKGQSNFATLLPPLTINKENSSVSDSIFCVFNTIISGFKLSKQNLIFFSNNYEQR